jgi:hypothetical protein
MAIRRRPCRTKKNQMAMMATMLVLLMVAIEMISGNSAVAGIS